MMVEQKFRWPTMFSGLKGAPWANLPNEISAGIALAALIIPLYLAIAAFRREKRQATPETAA